MAVLMLSLLAMVTVYVCEGIPIRESGNFPLNGCSTDQIDFLFLYFGVGYNYWLQYKLVDKFAGNICSHETTSRLLFAGVYDSFSANNPKVNVSSWQMMDSDTFLKQSKYTMDEQRKKATYYNNINETVRLKIEFVKRLFYEMGGVRKNVTHVGVIFLDGFSLSFEDSRSITHIVEQEQVADMKLIVVVFGFRHESGIVFMRDTLLVGFDSLMDSVHSLSMIICNQCSDKWFGYKLNNQSNFLSCYLFLESEGGLDLYDTSMTCNSVHGFLVTIETKEEMDFLQTKINEYLKDHGRMTFFNKTSQQSSLELYIGLNRDIMNLGKRLYWSYRTRPLVISHWLFGNKSGRMDSECVGWRFVWNHHRNDVTNFTTSNSGFDDGWFDVKCDVKLSSLSLCEVYFPIRVGEKNIMRIKPVTNETFSKVLTKWNLMTFEDNIVSVSANIVSKRFIEVFSQTKHYTFPLFDCGIGVPDPRYISYIYVCDNVDHCSNRRDEMFCLRRLQQSRSNEDVMKCHGLYCSSGYCLPLQWVGDGEIDCIIYGGSSTRFANDENDAAVLAIKGRDGCAMFCRNKCILFSQLNDNFLDCYGLDWPMDETIGKLETTDTCYNNVGHRIWAPRCVYIRDRYGTVIGCRDLSHLQNCNDFQCPEGYFKCLNNYCIPQHYVLDGTLDCPTGEDENHYLISECSGNFACWNSQICLHPDLVCNGYPDCPFKDDEVDCRVMCFDGWRCISGTIVVIDKSKPFPENEMFEIDGKVRFLNVSGLDLSENNFIFLNYLSNLTVVILSHCNIHNSNYLMESPSGLQELDLSYNQLQIVDGRERKVAPLQNLRHWNLSCNNALSEVQNLQMPFLETLDLSHTNLSLLDKYFLVWFPSLKHLNLSFTRISYIHRKTFSQTIVLQSLDLRGLFLTDFFEDFFNGLTINQDLFTDSFELCCPRIRGPSIPYHACHGPEEGISSCSDLLGIHVQRVLLWVIAVLAVLGNMAVIGYRLIWHKSVLRKGYGLFVTNLGISDFIMGVYLFIIAGADYYYRDVYILYEKSWRESVVCKFAGFLVTLSCETSTFFVFLITLDRFLVMKFPFGQVKFSKISKIIALSCSWIIGFLLALTPIVFRFEIYSSNAMCLGLPLMTERLNGWEFSFAVFIVLNLCLVLLIVYGQRAIFRAMAENRMSRVASKRTLEITVAKQLFLVALSNFLCWFPIGIMGLLSFSERAIRNDVYAWTTVIILPINSAANPLLYTIPALLAKWEQFKRGETITTCSS